MLDPIQSAIAISKNIDVKNQLLNKNLPQVPELPEGLDKLPAIKNPELIKKQIKAEAEKKKIQAEEFALNAKENAIEMGKDKLKELALQTLAGIKLDVIDPKILQAVALAQQVKDMIKQKRDKSRKNLDSINESLEYPMKVKNFDIPELPKIPKIPDLPVKIPDLNKIPNLPNVPKISLPKFP